LNLPLKKMICLIVLALSGTSLVAQVTPDQRVKDLETIAALYAKKYGPANWKIQALGVNPFDLTAWVPKVRAAKTDLEFVEVLQQYVASFQDTHSALTMQANFSATLGIHTDLYDGKLLIDLVDRTALPLARFPFVAGDELVSIDGRPAMDILNELAKLNAWGNPRATLRYAAQRVTRRFQGTVPRAVDVPEESKIEVRRASGDLETYTVKWTKTGFPIRRLGGVGTPFFSAAEGEPEVLPSDSADDVIPEWRKVLAQRRRASVRLPEMRKAGIVEEQEDGRRLEERAVLNYGSLSPVWALPTGFLRRLGTRPTDRFFTGTYMSEGKRIGYLRVPNFDGFSNAQLNQLSAEINFFNANTDGLVVDVMRNPGGNVCSVLDVAQFLVPGQVKELPFSFRPDLGFILYESELITLLKSLGAPQYVLDLEQFFLDTLLTAYNEQRGMTGELYLCTYEGKITSPLNAYSKPLVLMIDDFSTSAGHLFPATMQDNKRGKLVGYRSNGAGGSVVEYSAGWYSETSTSVTESLMLRLEEREYPGLPKSRFIENVGVRPDVELDYMTRLNLLSNGRDFVAAFTKILVDEINGVRP
jgi:hypothetical protein